MLQGEHSATLSTFIKLPVVIKIFVLSIFEWPFYTGFTFTVLTTYMETCYLNLHKTTFTKFVLALTNQISLDKSADDSHAISSIILHENKLYLNNISSGTTGPKLK